LLFKPLMRRRIVFLLVVFAIVGRVFSQDTAPTATPRRGWLGRLLHPFSSEPIPKYKNPRLRGLTLDLQITPQTVKLSEVRQLAIKISVTNLSKRPIPLDFPTNQRIEIYLRNAAGDILTKWSDNHYIK
jgi:hypothetical protein